MINVDFNDVKSVMQDAGSALMGIGSATGEDRALTATEQAIASPLLETSIEGAHGVLLFFQGGSDLGLFEISNAAELVREAVHPEANIIFGNVVDGALGDEVRVTVIAAGFDDDSQVARPESAAARPAAVSRQAPAVISRQAPAPRPVMGNQAPTASVHRLHQASEPQARGVHAVQNPVTRPVVVPPPSSYQPRSASPVASAPTTSEIPPYADVPWTAAARSGPDLEVPPTIGPEDSDTDDNLDLPDFLR